MMNSNSNGNAETEKLVRPRYFPRQMVTAADLTIGQDYFRERLRRHNRLLHGFGVVCGLSVTPGDITDSWPTVDVSAGYALSPDGDEIYVPESETVVIDCIENVAGDCLELEEVELESQTLYLVLRYAEEPKRPVPVLPEQCAPTPACENSRWSEGFAFACVEAIPGAFAEEVDCEELLQRFREEHVLGCDEIGNGSDVLLACLVIQRDTAGAVTGVEVDETCRRVLYSTATTQDVIRCLPREIERPQPPRILQIDPPPSASFLLPLDPPPNRITVEFDKDLEPTSINDSTFTVHAVRLDTPSAGFRVTGQVTYDVGSRTAAFVPAPTVHFPVPGDFQAGFRFHITLRGDLPVAIRDTENLRLDGDGDGQEGGNFQSEFTVRIVEEPHGHFEVHEHFEIHEHFEPHEHIGPHEHFDTHEHFEVHEHFDTHEHFEVHEHFNVHEHFETHEHFEPHEHFFAPHGFGPGPFFVAVEDVPGITTGMANILRENGLTDAVTLASRTPDSLAEMLDVSRDAAEMLIRIASQLSGG